MGFVHSVRMVWTYESRCVPAFVEGQFLGVSLAPGPKRAGYFSGAGASPNVTLTTCLPPSSTKGMERASTAPLSR